MKTPNVGDVVTVLDRDRVVRAKVARSYKRRFIVTVEHKMMSYVYLREPSELSWTTHESYERRDEGRLWVLGWDDETAVAFRAEKALAACR